MDLFSQITENTTLLTPNHRLSRYYADLYVDHQQKAGKSSWKTLDILPWNSWLERTWQRHTQSAIHEKNILLNSTQEVLLWEKIIRQSPAGQALLQISASAEIAKSAWGLLKQWRIEIDNPELSTTEDGAAFVAWAHEFQQLCKKNYWLDSATLIEYLIKKIQIKEIIPENEFILIGFAEYSPLQQKLLDACKHTKFKTYNTPNRNQTAHTIGLNDKEAELYTMARWAKAIYDKHPKEKPLRIACVIDNLEDIRATVNRIFTQVFSEKSHFTMSSLSLPFNITAGRSLAAYPLIHTALKILSIQNENINIETLSYLLRSPFIGDAESEMIARSNFDIQMRKENSNKIPIDHIISHSKAPSKFINLLQKFTFISDQHSETYLLSQWIRIFIDLLKSIGWPGERNINSEEYQLAQRWLKALQEAEYLDFVTDKLDYQQALHYINRMTADTVFQPESPDAPIQILGILEAAEIPCDHLWIMGMDDMQWPPAPKPNPFIPQALQSTLLMPHATAERELQFCSTILSQLQHCARQIIFSYPKHEGDSELQPSALLNQYNEITLSDLQLSAFTSVEHIIFQHQQLEMMEDTHGPSINIEEKIHGGVKIIELQALCPFKAFAELRLHAKPIENIELGLKALDKGNIVHKALEIIWNELKDSTTLHKKTSPELTTLIQFAIEKSIASTVKKRLGKKLYSLEKKRLEKILQNWMLIEKSRPPFTVIAQEQQTKFTIGNLSISMRVDRIDRIENHGHFIIDYKTGKNNNINHWFSDRPEAPQLPLYCIIDPTHTIGIAFGIINTERNELSGISKDNINIAKIKIIDTLKIAEKTWEKQIISWQDILTKLATDFHQGNAIVDPKNKSSTCEHCQLTTLCRINSINREELINE